MKRLSIKTSSSTNGHFRLNITPTEIEYLNHGSYIKDDASNVYMGVCINCENKLCMEYTPEELNTPDFNAFPHNTSKRVCPTHAIEYNSFTQKVDIISGKCIACGLCLHRCPTAAIQLNFTHKGCFINHESEIKQECSESAQHEYIETLTTIEHKVKYTKIPQELADSYQKWVLEASKKIPDVSEIIVRNTLLNMGIPCNTNAAGNNHMRTEFFGQKNGMVIIGESNSSDKDTLSVSRRILDDEAVMIGRYRKEREHIYPLAVLNGLPNKRTDYYEVIHDINKILGIKISTITYHILFVLNLFRIKLRINDFEDFRIDISNMDLLPAVQKHIPNIEIIDANIDSMSYKPIK